MFLSFLFFKIFVLKCSLPQAASVFVLYATSSANGVAQKSNRKTITGPDVVGTFCSFI